MAGRAIRLFLVLVLENCSSRAVEHPENIVELAAEKEKDPLKTWVASLQFHLPDSESENSTEASSSWLLYYDMVCKDLQFTRIHSERFNLILGGDPVFELLLDNISFHCAGKWKPADPNGWIAWSPMGSGAWEATFSSDDSAQFEVLFHREGGSPVLQKLTSLKCKMEFHSEILIHSKHHLTGHAMNMLLSVLRPFVDRYVKSQLQSHAEAAFLDLLEVKAQPYVDYLNKLFFNEISKARRKWEPAPMVPTAPPTTTPSTSHSGTVPNSSADNSATSSKAPVDHHHDPQLADWTEAGLLQWSSWLYEKVLPPDMVRYLAKAAGSDFLTLDLTELNLPSFEKVVPQYGARGLHMHVKVDVLEIQLKGVEGIQAYGIEAVSPSELRFSLALGNEEYPVTSLAAKLALKVEAKDDDGLAAATLEDEISVMAAVIKPSVASRVKVPIKLQTVQNRYTLAQYLEDSINCGLSFLMEAPVLEEMNISFESLSKPLVYTPNTEGRLEEELPGFFGAAVKIFNELFQEHLPGAIARLATSDGLDIFNSLLKKHLSPVECMGAKEAQKKIQGKFPRILNDWPKMLVGVQQYLVDGIQGFLDTNETKAPEDLLQSMPPIHAGQFSDVHVKELKAIGMSQIRNLKLFETDPKAPETISFEFEASCPSEKAPYQAMLMMMVEGTLADSGDALVEVKLPCGTFQTTLNLSIDTMEAATMLMPPSLFCTLLSPFSTTSVTNISAIRKGAGTIYVTLGSGTRHDVIEEACRTLPRLCRLIRRISAEMLNTEKATIALSYFHQEAVGLCDKMIEVTGRRLSADSGRKDSLGVSYEEFNLGILYFWLGMLSSAAGAGIVVWTVKYVEQKAMPGGNRSLAVHIIRSYGVSFAYVIAFLLCLAVCFRGIACHHLAYASIDIRSRYKPSNAILHFKKVAVYTYWGMAYQAHDIVWYLSFDWVVNGLFTTIAIFAIFAATLWILRLPSTTQHIILRVCIFFARQGWQESAILGLSAVATNLHFELPMDVEFEMRLNVRSGQLFGMLSTIFLSLAGVGMLVTVPLKSAQEEVLGKKRIVLLDLVLCAGIILGVLIWFFSACAKVGFSGVAGTILDPMNFSGTELGGRSVKLNVAILLAFVIAPFVQVCLVMTRMMVLRRKKSDVHRIVEEIFMSLNSFDMCGMAFFISYLAGSGGSSSAFDFVNKTFALCRATKFMAGIECIGMDAEAVPFGIMGLVMGSFCTTGLYISSSMQVHAMVGRPMRRRDMESNDETTAVELQ